MNKKINNEKVIIITGDLASGKSTFGKLLSEKIDAEFISKDIIKEKLADEIGFSNREENLKLSQKTFQIMIERLIESIKNHKSSILEANFRENEMLKILEICNKNNIDIKCFKFVGNDEILYQRFLDRLPYRHKAHTSLHLEESLEKFVEYLNYIRNQKIPFPFLEIDTTLLKFDEILTLLIKNVTF